MKHVDLTQYIISVPICFYFFFANTTQKKNNLKRLKDNTQKSFDFYIPARKFYYQFESFYKYTHKSSQ